MSILPSSAQEETPRFTITNTALNTVDDRIFGQFLERASFGEPGPEKALIPGTHTLQPGVVAKLCDMHIPITRFPGGTDVDFIDWYDLVDNVPGRGQARPAVTKGSGTGEITNNFGYDEFLRLCPQINTQPLLVVNFRDALLKKKPLAEAARHAAELVAYCNASDGAILPAGMPDWPAIRAKNGHPKPYGVRYFQIGNETWFFNGSLKELGIEGDNPVADWYVTCYEAYVNAMREVDPTIEIIVDGWNTRINDKLHDRLGDKVQYLAAHFYEPGPYRDVKKDGKPYPFEQMTREEMWLAWVGMPTIDPKTGLSSFGAAVFDDAKRNGYKVAVTEWNWNGWGGGHHGLKSPFDSSVVKSVGAAGFLNAMLRRSDVIYIGCQSMLVGVQWQGLAAIWVDPTGQTPAYSYPCGQMTTFYNTYHGHQRLDLVAEHIPSYEQPYSLGWSPAKGTVKYLDAVVTADPDRLYLHVINRHFDKDCKVQIDISAFTLRGSNAVQHCFTGRLNDAPADGEALEMASVRDIKVKINKKALQVTLPKRSVSIIEIPVKVR